MNEQQFRKRTDAESRARMDARRAEGCTPTDIRVLRQANSTLATEAHELREALADLVGQIEGFAEAHGEADFETGRAKKLLIDEAALAGATSEVGVRCYDGKPCLTGGCTEPCIHIPVEQPGGVECRNCRLAKIAQDNAEGAMKWAKDRLYPYVLREAGPKPVPMERIAELAAQAIDKHAREAAKWQDAYENMRDFAVSKGLDVTCYGDTSSAVQGREG